MAITSVATLNVPAGQTISKFYIVGWSGMTGEGCKDATPCTLTVTANAAPAGWVWSPGAFPNVAVTSDSGQITSKEFSATAPATVGATANLKLTLTCTKGCTTVGLSDSWTVMLVVVGAGCSSEGASPAGVPEFNAPSVAFLGFALFFRSRNNASIRLKKSL